MNVLVRLAAGIVAVLCAAPVCVNALTINTLGSGFNEPSGIAVDGNGNVFVADYANSAVKEILAVGGYTTVKTLGYGFSYPFGVAVDKDGNVFVADTGNNLVKEIFAAGDYTTVTAIGGTDFHFPAGIAVDGNGNVFVADSANNLVREIVAEGGYVTVKSLGNGFFGPVGIALDGNGNVFVGDENNNAVKQIVAAGGYVTVNTLGSGFDSPLGIAVDGKGNVYVADAGNHAVKQIQAEGGYATITSLGSGFHTPAGVAVDGSGNVFVADQQLAVREIVVADPSPSPWKTLATLPWTAIMDMSFVSGDVGYAAGGNGRILKTTDGAQSWTPVLALDSTYYWYGVQALSKSDIVISGFVDTPGPVQEAVIRWSHDGGDSWSDDLVVSDQYWANRVHFWNPQTGFATSINGAPNLQFRTTTGGLQLTDWTASAIDPDGGWFGSQFSALPNGHVRISGITYCESPDFAASWNCRPSIDDVFDDTVFFLDDNRGWVGGGGSFGVPVGNAPHFEGWVHLTTDGGASWSGRTLDGSWPINAIVFVDKRNGWAAGGGSDFGGVYVTHDGGQSWAVELDAGVGPIVCATADFHLFCAAHDNNATTHIYSRDYDHIKHEPFD